MTLTDEAALADALTCERTLIDWMRARAPLLLGFSGGVDSAYLASVAVEAVGAGQLLAVVGRSASLPAAQWVIAQDVAAFVGIVPMAVETRELEDPRYAANPNDRCFYCKHELWTRLAPIARARGMLLIDGTNADDLRDWRPGARAGTDHGVASPLAELGVTKRQVRLLSTRRGLPTAELPAAPCLASRLPYGTPVTTGRLAQVEAAESALRAIGVRGDLRVRHHGKAARVELTPEALIGCEDPAQLARVREAVTGAGFARVLVDLRGFRSGSLNVLSGVIPG